MGFNSSNSKSRDFAKQISYGGKVFDVVRSSVTQGAVNDTIIHLMLCYLY
jgi:hypothetical protein